jgi:hypothetical protein
VLFDHMIHPPGNYHGEVPSSKLRLRLKLK